MHFAPSAPNIAKKTTKTPPTLQGFKVHQTLFSMGRESSDPTVVSSSIALLQERFRQLQKVKERREEQQLLKMLSETDHHHQRVGSIRHFESDMARPSSPADHSLSLGLNLQTRQVDHCAMKTQPSTISWPNNTTAASAASASKSFDNSDLDTSLHL